MHVQAFGLHTAQKARAQDGAGLGQWPATGLVQLPWRQAGSSGASAQQEASTEQHATPAAAVGPATQQQIPAFLITNCRNASGEPGPSPSLPGAWHLKPIPAPTA